MPPQELGADPHPAMDRIVILPTETAEKLVIRPSDLAEPARPAEMRLPDRTGRRLSGSATRLGLPALILAGFLLGGTVLLLLGAWLLRPPAESASSQPLSPQPPPHPTPIEQQAAPAPQADTPAPAFTDTGHSFKELFASHKNRVVILKTPDGNGTGVVLWRDDEGMLIGTARHVVSRLDARGRSQPFDEVRVSSTFFVPARARVAGWHETLDVAVLWLPGKGHPVDFLQPILAADQIEVAESVCVIGHPLGQTYSFSDGKVTRGAEEGQFQFNASISSGNSGGPVYDLNGHLAGIVSAAFTARGPGLVAQNQNLAVCADVFLDPAGWNLDPIGAAKLAALAKASRPRRRPARRAVALGPFSASSRSPRASASARPGVGWPAPSSSALPIPSRGNPCQAST